MIHDNQESWFNGVAVSVMPLGHRHYKRRSSEPGDRRVLG